MGKKGRFFLHQWFKWVQENFKTKKKVRKKSRKIFSRLPGLTQNQKWIG